VEDTPQVVEDTPQVVEDTPQVVEDTPQVVEDTPQVVEDTPQVVEDTTQVVEDTPQVVEDKKKRLFCQTTSFPFPPTRLPFLRKAQDLQEELSFFTIQFVLVMSYEFFSLAY
jgi:hypothetical protein